MQTLAMDANNNLLVVQGSLSVLDGINACAQDTKTRVGLCLGENPLNQNEGIDYDNQVLGKGGGDVFVKSIIQARVLESEEIVNVSSINLTKQGDSLLCQVNINSIYGEIEI